jgi:DNA-binding MarR family transcriptional regulator
MKPREDGSENFVMLFVDELVSAAAGALADKRLEPRDLAVLLILLGHMNWRSGRVNITQKALAQQINVSSSNVCMSIKRLRQEQLIARAVDKSSGNRYFLINPRLASVGSPQRRGHLFQQFDEALDVAHDPE